MPSDLLLLTTKCIIPHPAQLANIPARFGKRKGERRSASVQGNNINGGIILSIFYWQLDIL